MFQKKQIFKLNILKQLLTHPKSCISLISSTKLLALPPFFLNDMKAGIIYLLNCMLKKYDRSLGGIIIGYQNIKVLMDENTGIIPMGTSETEINISVEFYIFQPKVGSLLEGVVNKRSSTHVGCLVHQYFNATILKPEDVDFDNWICKDFKVNDKIVFKVKELDFTSLLPLIEGVVCEDYVLRKESSRSDRNCDKSDVDAEVNKIISANDFLTRINTNEKFDSKVMKSTNKRIKNKEWESLDININVDEEKSHSSTETNLNVKNKKQKISVCISDENDAKKERSSEEREVMKSCDLDLKEYEISDVKKKKKKEKKMKETKSQDTFSAAISVEKENESNSLKCNASLDKCGELEDGDSKVFLSPFKLKEKKRKKKNEILLRKSECLSPIKEDQPEDNVFSSTQLEPGSASKMKILFCSPIPSGLTHRQKENPKAEELNVPTFSEVSGQQKTKKHKKRKREEDEKSADTSKRYKTSASSSAQEEEKFENNTMANVCLKSVSKVKKDSDISDNESIKSKSKKRKLSKKLNEQQLSGYAGEAKQQKSANSKQLNSSHRKNSMSRELEISEGTFELKGDAKAQTNSDDQTFNNKRKLGKSSKDEKGKVAKVKSRGKSKLKAVAKESEGAQEDSVDFLYNKLLRDAISAISMGGDISKKTIVNEDASPDELLVSSLPANKKKKKTKLKEKTNDSSNQKSEESFKNGNMYDVTYSPEKLNPDKCLFTDFEQSHNTPLKKGKLVNGSTSPSKVQSQLLNEAISSSVNVQKMRKGRKK